MSYYIPKAPFMTIIRLINQAKIKLLATNLIDWRGLKNSTNCSNGTDSMHIYVPRKTYGFLPLFIHKYLLFQYILLAIKKECQIKKKMQ